jgi:hypothetical protein
LETRNQRVIAHKYEGRKEYQKLLIGKGTRHAMSKGVAEKRDEYFKINYSNEINYSRKKI